MWDDTEGCHIDGLFLLLKHLEAIVGLFTALVLILFASGSREAWGEGERWRNGWAVEQSEHTQHLPVKVTITMAHQRSRTTDPCNKYNNNKKAGNTARVTKCDTETWSEQMLWKNCANRPAWRRVATVFWLAKNHSVCEVMMKGNTLKWSMPVFILLSIFIISVTTMDAISVHHNNQESALRPVSLWVSSPFLTHLCGLELVNSPHKVCLVVYKTLIPRIPVSKWLLGQPPGVVNLTCFRSAQ